MGKTRMEVPGLQKEVVVAGWDDAKYKDAILAKGQRRARKPNEPQPMNRTILKCTNCSLPVAINILPHCICSIWDRGKME